MTEVAETPKKILGAADIMAMEDVEYSTIPAFKEGEVFRLMSLTAGDMIEWTEANSGEAKRTAGLRLIVKSLVDEKGKRILDDTHIAMLRKKSHKVTERIVKGILELNGMQVKDKTTTGEADAKNG